MSFFDLTHAPVATAARAAATGLVSMSTRPDPEGSGNAPLHCSSFSQVSGQEGCVSTDILLFAQYFLLELPVLHAFYRCCSNISCFQASWLQFRYPQLWNIGAFFFSNEIFRAKLCTITATRLGDVRTILCANINIRKHSLHEGACDVPIMLGWKYIWMFLVL